MCVKVLGILSSSDDESESLDEEDDVLMLLLLDDEELDDEEELDDVEELQEVEDEVLELTLLSESLVSSSERICPTSKVCVRWWLMCFEVETLTLVELFGIFDDDLFGIFTDNLLIDRGLLSFFMLCVLLFSSSLLVQQFAGLVFFEDWSPVTRTIASFDAEDSIGSNSDVALTSRVSMVVILGFTVPWYWFEFDVAVSLVTGEPCPTISS